MKNTLPILMLCCTFCTLQSAWASNSHAVYYIIFTDGFKHDTIDLMINKTRIIISVPLISDEIDAVTNLSLNVSFQGNQYTVTNSLNKNINFIKSKRSGITMAVCYRNIWYQFSPQKEKGAY